jgi:hypothetical protein
VVEDLLSTGGHYSVEADIVVELKSSEGEGSGNSGEETQAKPAEEEGIPVMQEEEEEMLLFLVSLC